MKERTPRVLPSPLVLPRSATPCAPRGAVRDRSSCGKRRTARRVPIGCVRRPRRLPGDRATLDDRCSARGSGVELLGVREHRRARGLRGRTEPADPLRLVLQSPVAAIGTEDSVAPIGDRDLAPGPRLGARSSHCSRLRRPGASRATSLRRPPNTDARVRRGQRAGPSSWSATS